MSRFYPAAAAGSLAVAALSLLASTALTYDPWAWLVWGREVAQLELDTTAGPAWKPLPVAATTLLSPLGDAAPEAWLVVARAGGVLAVVLVALVVYRAVARNRLLAAGVAAVALVLVVGFVRGVTLGNSEGLLIAAAAAAFDRHRAGRRREAFVLGLVAALLRPEAWPFLALYGAWLVRRREDRALVLAAAVAVPVVWFAPELWGSGDLLRSSDRARIPNPGAPALADVPPLEVVKSFVLMLSPPMLAALFARGDAARLLAGAAGAWVGIVAALSAFGYSGEERYLQPAAAAVAALAGLGTARAVEHGRSAVAAVAAAALVSVPVAVLGARDLVADVRDDGRLQSGLGRAVAAAGGGGELRCGSIAAGRYRFPLVAWHLETPIGDVGFAPGREGVVLRSRLRRDSPLEPSRPPTGYRLVVSAGGWEVWSTCA